MPLLTDIGWGWVFLTAILAGAIIAVTEIELGLPGKWVFLAVETVLLFAVLIQLNRGLRRTPKFWAVMAALLVLHLVGLVSLLLRGGPVARTALGIGLCRRDRWRERYSGGVTDAEQR
jgi:hypothetical protein